jgi:hypothetical protein
MRNAFARTGQRLDRYTRELHDHGLESVDREVRWLDELIASERSGSTRPSHQTDVDPDRPVETH